MGRQHGGLHWLFRNFQILRSSAVQIHASNAILRLQQLRVFPRFQNDPRKQSVIRRCEHFSSLEMVSSVKTAWERCQELGAGRARVLWVERLTDLSRKDNYL
jgi:hypothetical protein